MMKRGFTLLEIMCAVMLLSVITTLAVLTSSAISRGRETSTDYMDKMERTDYALNQVVSALRSMYYPRGGQQSDAHGFVLIDNGNGKDPSESDVIEWTRLASVGSKEKAASTIHRMQVMILEEGEDAYSKTPIEATGLYMRRRPDAALQPKNTTEEERSFANKDLYEPILIADGIVGFNCRVLKSPPNENRIAAESEKKDFEDQWNTSNSVPYKVELTFYLANQDGKNYRNDNASVIKIVRIPIFEQSQDGATPPNEESENAPPPRRGI